MATTRKITNTKAALMVIVALTIDVIQAFVSLLHFIPLVGTIAAVFINMYISFFAYLFFWFWFALNGVVLFRKPRDAAALAAALLIETLPFLKIFPGITLWVFRIVITRRIRNKTAPVSPQRRIRRRARHKALAYTHQRVTEPRKA